MSGRETLYIFCYDIRRTQDRTRLANLLEENLVRVQKSVFEGMLRASEAERLAKQCARFLGEEDSLRVYCVSPAGHARSFVFGAGILPEREGYYLL